MCMTELEANYTLIHSYETTSLFRKEKVDKNRSLRRTSIQPFTSHTIDLTCVIKWKNRRISDITSSHIGWD